MDPFSAGLLQPKTSQDLGLEGGKVKVGVSVGVSPSLHENVVHEADRVRRRSHRDGQDTLPIRFPSNAELHHWIQPT